jgi:hypothetical protein
MVTKLVITRKKLDKKLFNLNVLGSNLSVTGITRSSGDFGGYSGKSETDGTPVALVGVPYNKTRFSLSYESFGNLDNDEMMAVFRYDTVIEKNDKVTYDSSTWRVKEKKDIPLNDGIAAIICKLKKDPSA